MKKGVSSLKTRKPEIAPHNVLNKSDGQQQMNVLELVRPADFELAYYQQQTYGGNDTSNKPLMSIPNDDVQIHRVNRKRLTIDGGIPANVVDVCNNKNGLLIKASINFYSSDWLVTLFKELSFNNPFWNLPNAATTLAAVAVNKQRFIIDEAEDRDKDSLLTFKTKGSYFENQLAVCTIDDYQQYVRQREDELSNSGSGNLSVAGRGAVPRMMPFSLSEMNDGTRVLKESMPRDGHEQAFIYLDNVEAVREIGATWVLLTFRGHRQQEAYLYAADRDNQRLWLKHLRDAIEAADNSTQRRRLAAQDSLDRMEDSGVQAMLARFLKEDESAAAAGRRKDRQRLLFVYPDVRNMIRRRVTGQMLPTVQQQHQESDGLMDKYIRPQVEQTVRRVAFRITAGRLLTGLSIVAVSGDDGANKRTSTGDLIPPEPFFVTFCLIHVADGRRISEEFHWNPNRQEVEAMLPQQNFINRWDPNASNNTNNGCKTPNGLPTMPDRLLQGCRSFIVRSAYPPDAVCVLVRVDKVFSGAVGQATDKYSKHGDIMVKKQRDGISDDTVTVNGDIKMGAAVHKTMSAFCANVGHYRMPFAWTFVRLGRNHGIMQLLRLFKYEGGAKATGDDDLMRAIQVAFSIEGQSSGGGSSSGKMSQLQAYVELLIEPIEEDGTVMEQLTDVVSAEFVCKTSCNTTEATSCTKEVNEFTYDPFRTTGSHSHSSYQLKGLSTESGSTVGSTKGSMVSLHNYSDLDDNSPGDITPPAEFNFQNQVPTKVNSFIKAQSASLSRITGTDVSKSLSTKGFDMPESLYNSAMNCTETELVSPNLDFCHILYLYPKCLNFSNQNSFSRARNISCFVEIRESEKYDDSPLKVFFSRPTSRQSAFDSWVNTAVFYHESSPNFNEEIKIALPFKLHTKHHILFRFYHVSCDTAGVANIKDKSSNKKHLETSVGYSWLPLLDKNSNIISGQYSLPVATQLVSDYLDERHSNAVQWVDSQKLLFSIVLRPETTIYCQDNHVHRFFQACSEGLDKLSSTTAEKKDAIKNGETVSSYFPISEDIEIKNAIKGLASVDVVNLVKFIGPIFNQLLTIIIITSSTNSEMSKTAVNTMIMLSSSLRTASIEPLSAKATKRNTKILKSFIKYAFDSEKIIPTRSKKTVHECLVQTIAELITPPFRDANYVQSFLFNSFLLYSIITKSMVQSLSKFKKLSMDRGSEKCFSTGFMESLENMIHLITNCILDLTSSNVGSVGQPTGFRHQTNSHSLTTSANKDLARFISRLLNVMDRTFVLNRIHKYMVVITGRINQAGSDREHLIKMKFDFLEILTNHEHFLPLNLISASESSERASTPELNLSESYCKNHYLLGLLLQQVHQQMSDIYSSSSTRRIPFVLLRNLFAKHLFDDRYKNSPALQAKIGSIYLPLLSIIMENQKSLSLPGSSYKQALTGNNNDQSDRSLSSRPTSSFSTDTVSTHSSMNGSAGDGGGSVYGVGFGGATTTRQSRSSQMYLDREGKVEDHWLKEIAGLSDDGSLRSLMTKRQIDSDTSSVHSSSTLIGIDEIRGGSEDAIDGITDEDDVPVRNGGKEPAVMKSISLQRPVSSISGTSSIGKKVGLALSLSTARKGPAPIYPGQRTSGITMINYADAKSAATPKTSLVLNDKSQKDLFLCLVHVLGTVSTEDMRGTIGRLTVHERVEFIDLLILSLNHLRYQGRQIISNFESISVGKVKLRTANAKATLNGGGDESDASDDKPTLDGNVSTEVGLVVLDVLSVFCTVFKQEILTYNPDYVIFRKIIELYLTMLSINQSETVLIHVFVSLRVFISTFGKVLFSSCHSVLCDLSLPALRFLDSVLPSVRAEACGLLYRMMRCSYDMYNKQGFNRVHLQMIVAVSKLDRTVGLRFNNSLTYIKRLAEAEAQKLQVKARSSNNPSVPPKPKKAAIQSTLKMSNQSFYEEVVDLTQRIRTVLMATVQMNEHKDDPEMLVDLQYSLAKSYSSNPALRRTWLEKIYAVHLKNNSHAEMAMCKAHIVAMITEYLRRKDLLPENYRLSCSDFKNISPNIPVEEGEMKDDSTQLEVHYTKEEVIKLLREVALEFDSANLWEVLRYIYVLLIPIYEKNRDYEQLAEIYQNLASGYIKIKNAEATNQRLIGSYYRVVLYGKPFESLAGKVFIYRLDSGKQFCVAREDLQRLFSKKYGDDRSQMIVENHVDRSKLDPEMASIQVTHVEPFFEEEEELTRRSMFERQYNISKFMLETPFVKQKDDDPDVVLKSKQTDDLSIQWKRRTVLTVEGSFPHLKRRLEVICTKEIDFSPIERAIDEIKSKNRQLAIHVVFNKSSVNVGTKASGTSSVGHGTAGTSGRGSSNIHLLMDMHLTGALLPQVNQGPMAYARVFLDKENQNKYPVDKVKQLKIEFMIFLTLCHLLLDNYYQLMSQVHEPKYQAMKQALQKYRMDLIEMLHEEITYDEEKMIISTLALSDDVKQTFMKRGGFECNQ